MEKRSESDGRFISLCALDAGLSDRDRLGHRSIGLVMSTRVGFCPNLGSYDLTSKAVSVVPQGTTRSRLTSCVNVATITGSGPVPGVGGRETGCAPA